MADRNSMQRVMARIQRHLQAGEHAVAAELCRSLLEQKPDQPQVLGTLGVLEGMAGNTGLAKDLLTRANELSPGNPGLVNNLALACMKTGDLDGSERYLRACLKRHPGFAPAWYTLAGVKRRQGDTHEAVSCYERVLSIEPQHAEAWACVAQLRERLNQLQLAAEAAERSLALDPSNDIARLAAAQIDLRLERYPSVRARLESLLSEGRLSPTNEVVARGRLADALEALGRYPEAFAQAEAANRRQAESYPASAQQAQGPYSLETINRLAGALDGLAPTRPAESRDDHPGPFFLMGFPRSGTTLLDRMLSAHPGVVSIEEQETLTDAHRDFLMAPGGIDILRTLPESGRIGYSAAYRRRVADAVEQPAPVVLDKLPLHTISLPVIARLFPAARIIFVLRDPRDVCLSCFMQRFDLNAAMAHFLDLETTAHYYRAVMDLGLDSIDRLPIAVREVRYEALVDEPEPILRELVSFLGLDWDPAVLDYRSRIQGSAIDTPSYRQVAKPLYRSSIGRWRNYADQLEPVREILAPVVSRLGYG